VQEQEQEQEQESEVIVPAEPWVWCEQQWSGESNPVSPGATIYIDSASSSSSSAVADGFATGETCCCHCGWTMQAPSRVPAMRCANTKCRAVIRKKKR
jgi:hypothetical protein